MPSRPEVLPSRPEVRHRRSDVLWEADTVVLPVAARPGAVGGEPRPGARRPALSTILIVLAVVVAVIGVVGHRVSSASSAPAAPDASAPSVPAAIPGRPAADVPLHPPPPPGGDAPHGGLPGSGREGALGEADGAVPDGVTVFDDDVPAVAELDPALLDALRRAATDAADDGVRFSVTSGWRSPAYQAQLLREAVSTYGSQAEAARWVATPETSLHVSGDAVDLGPTAATTWLAEHGAEYGLCRVYRNEPWHHELRPDAVEDGCPRQYPDPTHDPRMQK